MTRTFEIERGFVRLLIVMSDVALLLLADLLAFHIRFGGDYYLTPNFADYEKVTAIVLSLKLLCMYVFHVYTNIRFKSQFVMFINFIKAMTLSSLVMALAAYFLRAESIPRLVIVYSWLLSILLLFSWHAIRKMILRSQLGEDYFKSHFVIIGTNTHAQEIAIRLLHTAVINYKMVGFITEDEAFPDKKLQGFPVLGSISNIKNVAQQHNIDHVIVATANLSLSKLTAIFSTFKGKRRISFSATTELSNAVVSHFPFSNDISLQLYTSMPFQGVPSWYVSLKRILDLLMSLLLLVILSPVMLVTALLVKATSPGPVFYITRRVGLMGREFIMYKFRTMYEKPPSAAKLERWTKKSDQRITPIGGFLRRYRLDELPQLFNVIRGEMSLIGPRPETKYYTNRLLKMVVMYSERLKAKPGISGWAQVNFGYAGSVAESREKLLFDIYYVQNQSISLDLLIALKTIKAIVLGTGR